MKFGGLCVMVVLTGGCSAPPATMAPDGVAPDAVFVTGSSSGEHMLAVTRPTYWQGADGRTVIDERITLAVVDVEAACWRLAARLDDAQAVALVAALEAAMMDLPAGQPLPVLRSVAAMGAPEIPVLVPRGRWHVERLPEAVNLQLLDGQGQVLARVELGAVAVEDLHRRLRGFARLQG